MKPYLKHYDDFQAVLNNYSIGDEGKKMLESVRLVLLVSPAASGRSELADKLVETGSYNRLVSDTTRAVRTSDGSTEQDGVNYWFKSEDEVLEGLKNGRYLEADIIHGQQVSGISLSELEKAVSQGKIALSEVYFNGADKIKTAKPDTEVIFVLPPSYEQWISRLQKRGDLDSDEIKRRLESAEKELQSTTGHDYYRFVINENPTNAVAAIRRIVENGDYSDEEHQAGKDLAWSLLAKVKQQLYS
jgi:guanylate kinase